MPQWSCKICNEAFHDEKSFQEHWDSEMEMALQESTRDSASVTKKEINRFKIKFTGNNKTVPFKNCFGDPVDDPAHKPLPTSAFDTRQRCPLCDKPFHLSDLQQHVEEELESMESINRDSLEELSKREPTSRGVLVIGGAPQPRKKPRKSQQQQIKTHFNHYADGKGWWDEDTLGMDGASEFSWEGFGSVNFGSFGGSEC